MSIKKHIAALKAEYAMQTLTFKKLGDLSAADDSGDRYLRMQGYLSGLVFAINRARELQALGESKKSVKEPRE